MPIPLVAGNWKMNTTINGAKELAMAVRDQLGTVQGIDVLLCPPFISLLVVYEVCQLSAIKLGAQNMHFEAAGAFTGEISPLMLRGLCTCVILGHSERRQLFSETDSLVNQKVKAAFQNNLRPILCVGETLEQRERGQAASVVSRQVRSGLDGVDNITGLVVAYEPIWAIGTGRAATPETASEIMGTAIFDTLRSMYRDAADAVPLLYGGSVNPGNIAGFVRQNCIHGALVGGASLQTQQFVEIVQATARAKAEA